MVVRIRLARFGKRNNPLYNIVVAHARLVALVTINGILVV
jgi:ribosomal protein S16